MGANVKCVDTRAHRGERRTKGRGWAWAQRVHACPFCDHLVWVHVLYTRRVVVCLVEAPEGFSSSVPLREEVELDGCLAGGARGAREAAAVPAAGVVATAGDGADVPITAAIASAQVDLFPAEGGFTDDEAPFPTPRQ